MSSFTAGEHRDLLARVRAALETPGDLDNAARAARAALIAEIAVAGAMRGFDPVCIALALIDSGSGTEFYAATSHATLTRELAVWCRLRWDRTGDPRDPATLGDDEIVGTYFAGDVSEYFAIGTARIASDATNVEQGRYCVLSTAHLSHATSEWLERWSAGPPPPSPLPIATTFYGWFVSTREPDAPSETLPADLLAAMRFGRQRGFDHLLFDSDAARVGELDVHDW